MRLAANLAVLAVLVATYFGMWFVMWPELPERMVTHWGAGGQPNGWADKGQFFGLYTGISLGTIGMVVGMGFGIAAMPSSLINIPHKDYWLAPERKAQTMASLRNLMLEGANLTMAFLLIVLWSVFRANQMGGVLPPLFM